MTKHFPAQSRTAIMVALALGLSAPAVALAQDTTTGFPPAKLILTDADGTESQYEASEVSFYVSTTEGYDGTPATTDLSMSIGAITPVDAALLEWASQASPDEKQIRTMSIVAQTGEGKRSATMRYDVTGAYVSSMSMSISSYSAPGLSLSMSADTIALDGIALK